MLIIYLSFCDANRMEKRELTIATIGIIMILLGLTISAMYLTFQEVIF